MTYGLLDESGLRPIRYSIQSCNFDRIERDARHQVVLSNRGIMIKSIACADERTARNVENIAAAIMIKREDGWEEPPRAPQFGWHKRRRW